MTQRYSWLAVEGRCVDFATRRDSHDAVEHPARCGRDIPAPLVPAASLIPGCCEKAASDSASGSSPPWAAQALAAAARAAPRRCWLGCQQAPAKARVPALQPAPWPLTVFALTALAAFSAVSASCAESAVSAWTAVGTWPRVAASIWIPVIEPGASWLPWIAPGCQPVARHRADRQPVPRQRSSP